MTFVGRSGELAVLNDVAARSAAGEPWVVEVRAAAGMGKTSLVRRFLDGLDDRTTVLEAAPARARVEQPYGLLDQLVSQIDLSVRTPFGLVDGIPAVTPPFTAASWLIGALGALQEDGPVVIVVDDLQWADTASVQALTCALGRLWADSVLTVLAVRTDDEADQLSEPAVQLLTTSDRIVQLDLIGLTAEDVTSLAEALGCGTLSAADAERLRAHTDGNALYLYTLLTELGRGAQPPRLSGELPVPDTLADSVRAPLRDLPDASRALVDGLAVLDEKVPLALAVELADVTDAAAALEPAMRAGLVERHTIGPTSEVALRHSLHRDVIYAELAPARKRWLHARAAGLVDETTAWRHRVAAADGADEALAAALEELAEAELGQGRYTLASAHLRAAADLSATTTDRQRRLLAATIPPGTEYVQQVRELRGALSEFADSPLRSYALGMANFVTGQLEDALRWWQDAVHKSSVSPEAAGIAGQCLAVMSTVAIWRGDGADAISLGQQAIATGALVPAHHLIAEAMVAEGFLMLEGPARALEQVKRLPPADQVANDDLELVARRADFRLLAGDLHGAAADAATVTRRALRDITPAGGDIYAASNLTMAHYLLGQWEEATIAAERAQVALGIQEHPWDACWAHMASSLVPSGRGEWEIAERHVEAARQVAAMIGGPLEVVFSSLAGAVLGQARANADAVLTALRPVTELPSDNGWVRGRQLWWRPLHVHALATTGKLTEAADSLAALRDVAHDVAYAQRQIHWLAGVIARERGDHHEALDHFRAGLADTGAPETPLHLGLLEHDHGTLLGALGQRRQASRWLHRARARFSALGATPFLERTDLALTATGTPSPGQSRTATGALSAREREIAHLVERGLTNSEIATELFVSGKTVEYHLGNMYRKLNVKGRHELRAVVLADQSAG